MNISKSIEGRKGGSKAGTEWSEGGRDAVSTRTSEVVSPEGKIGI